MNGKDTAFQPAAYHVRFFRTVTNEAGKCGDCVVHTVEIRRARSAERAVAAAQVRLQRRFHLRSWDLLAHGYRIDRP